MLRQNTVPEQPILGCDVSAATITLYNNQTGEIKDIANTPRSVKALLRRFPTHQIACEVTGGYEATLTELAHDQGHTVYRVHPNRINAFIKASGQAAKTDPLDACAIAQFVKMHGTTLMPFTPPTAEHKALSQLSRRRDELVRMRVSETNRLKAPDYGACQASIKAVLRTLVRELERVEGLIAAIIAKDEALRARQQILLAIPGIGPTTAHVLVAFMPEMGTLSGKQIAALAGLAPFARQSGVTEGYRRTGRGRVEVKRALFMAALSATRYNPNIKTFYQRLISNGKKPMVALIAAARKLIVIANAKLRDEAISKQS